MYFIRSALISTLLGSCALLNTSLASAAATHIAVAANFTDAATEIAAAFAKATEHEAILSFGSTGQFYTQITQAAPFEVFLAADDQRPTQAVEEGYGVKDTIFTYAIGQLVLYSANKDTVTGPDTLKENHFKQLAIANPQTAPYGVAAVETMTSLDLYDAVKPKLVQGQNIGQTYQFVQTGNAELGFIALGQVAQTDVGSRWVVPQEFYQPIRQDAVLLKTGSNNPAAIAFLEFLQSDTAAEIIQNYGYALDR